MGKIVQNGVIYTGTGGGGGGGASSVDQLTDVQLTTPTTGDELVYNSSLTSPYKWENKKLTWTGTQAQYDLIATPDPDVTYFITDSDTGNYGINDLANVNITSAANGQLLTYDSANSIWVNKKPANLPIAYLQFSSTYELNQVNGKNFEITIVDEFGNSLTPTDLVDSDLNLIYDCRLIYSTLDSSNNVTQRWIFDTIIGGTTSSGVYSFEVYREGSSARYLFSLYYFSTQNYYKVYCYAYPITYDSKTAASGGTDLSLVTTGEKYTWNNTVSKTDLVVTDSEYYGNGTTQAQAITSIITKYGKKTLIFKFIINGDAWYEGTITFYDNTQGGGYLIRNSTTPKLYAIAIQNDTAYLSEK